MRACVRACVIVGCACVVLRACIPCVQRHGIVEPLACSGEIVQTVEVQELTQTKVNQHELLINRERKEKKKKS